MTEPEDACTGGCGCEQCEAITELCDILIDFMKKGNHEHGVLLGACSSVIASLACQYDRPEALCLDFVAQLLNTLTLTQIELEKREAEEAGIPEPKNSGTYH